MSNFGPFFVLLLAMASFANRSYATNCSPNYDEQTAFSIGYGNSASAAQSTANANLQTNFGVFKQNFCAFCASNGGTCKFDPFPNNFNNYETTPGWWVSYGSKLIRYCCL